MGFIRTKRIKGNQYAYHVENKWKKKTSKQKVRQYLGRVYIIEKKQDFDFLNFIGSNDLLSYIEYNDKKRIISDLIIYEAYCCGFKKIDKNKWRYNNIIINLDNRTIIKHNKNIVLKMNEGFLCNHTLTKLFEFNQKGRSKDIALNFARLFVDAGLKIPKEIFVELFQKINKNTKFLD